MVCIRNLTGLLLALAAAPSVLSKPVAVDSNDIVARAKNNGLDLEPLIGGGTSSVTGGNGGSVSEPPSVSSTNPPTNSPSATTSPTSPSATPTNSPTSVNSPSNTPSQTQQAPSQTSTPTQVTSIPATTSLVIALTTLPASAGQSTFIVVQTTTTGMDGVVGTGIATQAVAAATAASQADGSNSTPPPKPGVSTGTIVGAAVGGVAGLVLIIALVAVSWRIWGKNRHRAEEDDALMDDGVYGTSEVKATSGTSSGTSPFQNNLEQYHNGRANPSANF